VEEPHYSDIIPRQNGKVFALSTSEDPLGLAAGDANVAKCVGNNVTGATDASGLEGVTLGKFKMPNLVIDGSSIKDDGGGKEFVRKVQADLMKLKELPAGEGLLVEIVTIKDRQITIVPRPGNQDDNLVTWPDGKFPGPPQKDRVDPIVKYDPDDLTGGTLPGGDPNRRPPYIGLGHELSHAVRAMKGTMDLGPLPGAPGDVKDQIPAIRLENTLRIEHNRKHKDRLPPRTIN
jgi:hypothetical protein